MSTEAGSSTDTEPDGLISEPPNVTASFYTSDRDMIFGKPSQHEPTAATRTAPEGAPIARSPVHPITPTDVAQKPSNTTARRKRTHDETTQNGPAINEAPTQKLNVYVCGENSNGELGLGTATIARGVKRPRLNANLDMSTVGVVQLDCGGMHVIALTHGNHPQPTRPTSRTLAHSCPDNKVLTWGVNDNSALGRDTTWEVPTRDMDTEGSESEDSESPNGLNPFEASPAEVDWSQTALAENTKFTHVAAGDSCSFAVTDDGYVYGWGTFRDSAGVFGFTECVDTATRPILIPYLTKIASVSCCANAAFALSKNGVLYSWGCGEHFQLGRRILERHKYTASGPRALRTGIVSVHPGNDHCFAISRTGHVYAWGLNNYAQTGIRKGASTGKAAIEEPTIVESLKEKEVVDMAGGSHHSIAATRSGDCLAWGRVDSYQLGIDKGELERLAAEAIIRNGEDGKLRIVVAPQKVDIDGEVRQVAAASDHSLAVTKEGEAFSWGFNVNFQTGQGGEVDDVEEATLVNNTAVRGKKLVAASSGGQFTVLCALRACIQEQGG